MLTCVYLSGYCHLDPARANNQSWILMMMMPHWCGANKKIIIVEEEEEEEERFGDHAGGSYKA